jgi:hypothetical protein
VIQLNGVEELRDIADETTSQERRRFEWITLETIGASDYLTLPYSVFPQGNIIKVLVKLLTNFFCFYKETINLSGL